jgi:hypothetical protein
VLRSLFLPHEWVGIEACLGKAGALRADLEGEETAVVGGDLQSAAACRTTTQQGYKGECEKHCMKQHGPCCWAGAACETQLKAESAADRLADACCGCWILQDKGSFLQNSTAAL